MQLPACAPPKNYIGTSAGSLVRVAPFELYYNLYKEKCMKGVTASSLKEFAAVGTGTNPAGGIVVHSHFDTEAQAQEFASRTVAASKGGEIVIYKALKVIRLPVPEVEIVDLTK